MRTDQAPHDLQLERAMLALVLTDNGVLDRAMRLEPEHFFDAARLVIETENDLVDLRHTLDQIELIVEKRSVEDGHDRFGLVNRERAEACALAPCEQDGLHA